jgi:hypothetical protein
VWRRYYECKYDCNSGVIEDLKEIFDSHDSIQKFSKRIELDYVYLLATSGSAAI